MFISGMQCENKSKCRTVLWGTRPKGMYWAMLFRLLFCSSHIKYALFFTIFWTTNLKPREYMFTKCLKYQSVFLLLSSRAYSCYFLVGRIACLQCLFSLGSDRKQYVFSVTCQFFVQASIHTIHSSEMKRGRCMVFWSSRFFCVIDGDELQLLRWLVCTLQILDTPSLLADASSGAKKNIFKQKPPEADAAASSCC